MLELSIKTNNQHTQRFTVRDHRGQIVYVINGRWGRKQDVLSIYKLNGDLLMSIKQIKQTPLPVFEVVENGERLGLIRKHPGLFGIRDTYYTLHPHEWVIVGDFEDLYFTATKGNHMIMECEKFVCSSNDIFKLLVEEDHNAPLCALLSIILDPYSRIKEEKEIEEVDEKGYDLGLSHNFMSLPTYLKFANQENQRKEKTR